MRVDERGDGDEAHCQGEDDGGGPEDGEEGRGV